MHNKQALISCTIRKKVKMYNILDLASRPIWNKSQNVQYTSFGKLDYKEQKPKCTVN